MPLRRAHVPKPEDVLAIKVGASSGRELSCIATIAVDLALYDE
jgi:hypothetical protein